MILYAIHPGMVESKTDGQQHFIGARELMNLYGVTPRQCLVYDPPPVGTPGFCLDQYNARFEGLRPLYPRYDGNYELT